MTAVAELPALAQVRQLAERQTREAYWRCHCALSRLGKVPKIKLGHQAYRVLQFLLGQRPGYFAHHQVIADAIETNLTSVRKALFELRDAGLVSWQLIPPHHPLPTGNYSRTNVNQYFVEADALLRALDGGEAAGPPRTVASTHPNSSASTGTDPKFEQDPPLPPRGRLEPPPDRHPDKGEIQFSKFHGGRPALRQPPNVSGVRRADQDHSQKVPRELEKVLAAWRALHLGEPDDRSVRALRNRYAEGATSEQLAAAVEGARHDEWLRDGRAKSPFAVVFASLASVERFASSGREHARRTETTARERAAERRAARARFDDVPALSPAESAELAALALRTMAYPAPPPIRSNYSTTPTSNSPRASQFPPSSRPIRARCLAPRPQQKYKLGGPSIEHPHMEEGWEWERPPRVDLSLEDLERLVQPAFPGASICEHAVLATGLANTNIRFRLDGAESSYVLRFHTRDPKAAAREQALMKYLVSDPRESIPVAPLVYSDPESHLGTHPYSIWRFVEGTLLQELFKTLPDSELVDIAAACGRVAAAFAIHRFSTCGEFGANLSVVEAYGAPSRYVPDFVCKSLYGGLAGERLGVRLRDALWSVVERRAPLLEEIDGQYTLVHGDYKRSNILLQRSATSWNVTAVLDWEFAFAGPPITDIGLFLRAGEALPAGFRDAFATGYRDAGGELPSDWLRLSRLVDLISQVTFLNDPRDRPRVVAESTAVVEETVRVLT